MEPLGHPSNEHRGLRLTGAAMLVVAFLAIVGWIGRWPGLTTWLPGGSPMVMNTALCTAVAAGGLLALAGGRIWVARICGALVVAFAGVVLAQFVFARPLGVDELFWRHPVAIRPGSTPGRMAGNTAVALVLIGFALSLMAARRAHRVWLTVAGVVVLTLATLPLLSYVASISGQGASYRGMSLPTMISVLLFASAIFQRVGQVPQGRDDFFPPMMAAAVSLLIGVGVVSAQSNAELIDSGRRVVRAHEVRTGIELVVARVARMETNARGYAISGQETMRTASISHERELVRLLGVLDGLVADHPAQAARAVELRRRAVEKIGHNTTILEARRTTGGIEAPTKIILSPSAATANGMISLGNEMKAEESRLLGEWQAEMAQLTTNTRTLQLFGSAVALALVGLTVAQTFRAAGARRAAEAATSAANHALSQRVAELAAARAELEAASRLQRGVLDGTVHSVISTTADGTITSFNAGAEKMLGYRREEIVGRATPEIIHVGPEVVARAAELSAQLGRRIEPGFEAFVARARLGEVDEREWTYRRKDGSRLPVSLSITALRDEAGAITGFLGIAQDLTERRRMQAARTELLERLEKIGRQVPGMIYQFRLRPDGTSCFPYTSEGIREIYRVAPDDVREDAGRVFGVLHPDDVAAVVASIQLSARTLQPWRHEYRVRHADGTERWLAGASVPEREPDGSVLWHGFITDITERRRVERAVEEQEARLRLVIEQMPIGVRWVRVVDGRRETVLNPAHEEITGVSRAESEVPGVYLSRTHPDDIAAQEAAMARIRNREIRQFSMEKRYLQPGGRINWVTITWARRWLPGEGNFEELSTVKDITERKEAELAFRASVREVGELRAALDAHALVVVTDLEGRIIHVNARFCELSKYPAGELIGQTPRLLNSRAHPAEFFQEMWATITAGKIWRGELRNRAKDGTDFWVASAVVPSLDETGRPVRFVAIQIDITERKRLEQSLALARDQALEASRLKSEFLATISHEIRTPMNAVIGMAGLLAETKLDQEQDEMTRTILGGAENLLAIINDILDFSRIEAGRMRLEPVDFDFRRIVEDAVALLALRAHEKGLELICEFEPAPSARLHGDSGRVRQVLLNLIGNAIKFTDAGEVEVRVCAVAETAQRTRVRVTVRDTGVGIPPEARHRLFQPFTQADGSPTRRFGGTGLGLAISRQLVDLMGGVIGFESEPGKGSSFWFELEFNRRGAVAPIPAAPIPAGRTVMVVDDNATNRRILIGQLSRWGLRVEAVADGAAALARLRTPGAGPWHLILLDWHMPAMSGMELAVELRADPVLGGVPLVMLSSAGSQADVATATAIGFAAFLNKPVTSEQLGRCVSRVLSESPAASAAAPAVAPEMPAGGAGKRLLLAEDNPANQRVAAMLLAKMGYAVDVAANGQLALALLGRHEFSAVLMDCQMPVLDGYETARRIRSGQSPGVNARIPIVALTAYARPEDRARCLEAGMDDYVTKPIRPVELRAALQRCGLTPGSVSPFLAAGGVAGAEDVFDRAALEAARALPGVKGPSLLPELIALYLSDEAERLDRLALLAAERQGEKLGDEAHSFGGNAASFGGMLVRRVALKVEVAARAADWPAVEVQLEHLREECARLRSEVAQLNVVAG